MKASPEQLERFATLVQQRLGLQLGTERRSELAQVLAERSAGRVEGYLQRLAAQPEPSEVRALGERLTVGETYFLRHLPQLQVLTEQLLPALLREVPLVRVLCAGCSTGEEAYSVALLARESHQVDASRVQVLGVDINPSAIAHARRARYSRWALRATPRSLRERWFREHSDGTFALLPEVRDRVLFEERNLLDEAPAFWAPSSFDVILCRNVTIYFPTEVTQRFVARMAQALTPRGYLLLGPSETLRGISTAFTLQSSTEAFYYQHQAPGRLVRSGHEPLVAAPALVAPRHHARPRPGAPPAPEAGLQGAAALPGASSQALLEATGVLRLLEQERYGQAQAQLEAWPASELLPPEAQLMRAVLHLQSGHPAQAERLGQHLIEAGICVSEAHYLLGLCHEQVGDEAGARARYERAARVDPTFALAHLRAGMLARRAGAPEAARVALRMALTLLAQEQPLHLTLFGGGFGRHGLMQMGQQELLACTEAA